MATFLNGQPADDAEVMAAAAHLRQTGLSADTAALALFLQAMRDPQTAARLPAAEAAGRAPVGLTAALRSFQRGGTTGPITQSGLEPARLPQPSSPAPGQGNPFLDLLRQRG